MSFSVTSAKPEFTPATISLATSREVDIEQLFAEVEVNRRGYSPSCECGEVNILGQEYIRGQRDTPSPRFVI